MTSEHLSALALMHIHYGHPVDYDRIIDIFRKLHPRKLDHLNFSCMDAMNFEQLCFTNVVVKCKFKHNVLRKLSLNIF